MHEIYPFKGMTEQTYSHAVSNRAPWITEQYEQSAQRHILQRRLQIAGAWWRLERAEEMTQLRTLRANQRWDEFWEQKAA